MYILWACIPCSILSYYLWVAFSLPPTMAFFKSLAILLLLVFSAKLCIGEDYKDCSTNKSTLLKALFDTADNLFQLDTAFASPGEDDHTSRYIKVIYSFADKDGNFDNKCTVTYIWAIGAFLLIHPPEIFQYTSLYFSTPANDQDNIILKLPYNCRGLINNIITDTCICYRANKKSSKRLLVVTNQVNSREIYFQAPTAHTK